MQKLPFRRTALLLALCLWLSTLIAPALAQTNVLAAVHETAVMSNSDADRCGLTTDPHDGSSSISARASSAGVGLPGSGWLELCIDWEQMTTDDPTGFYWEDSISTPVWKVISGRGQLAIGWRSFTLSRITGTAIRTGLPDGLIALEGVYMGDDGSQGRFETQFHTQWDSPDGCCAQMQGTSQLIPLGASPDAEPCSDSREQVWWEEYNVGSGENSAKLRVDVHQTDDEVQVCTRSSRGSSPVFNHDLIVPTDPDVNPGPPPVTVDDNAPAGDGTDSPCDEHVASKGGSADTYVRKSSGSGTPATVCVGLRAGGAERHVRITIG